MFRALYWDAIGKMQKLWLVGRSLRWFYQFLQPVSFNFVEGVARHAILISDRLKGLVNFAIPRRCPALCCVGGVLSRCVCPTK